ncbi:MAG: hypothetical protein H6922_04660 [Pseudomonadaceae bacterium]|nr:hypothetical protein [Pseudomonadaceae bacterium]
MSKLRARYEAVTQAIIDNTPPDELAKQLGISENQAKQLIRNKLNSGYIGDIIKSNYTHDTAIKGLTRQNIRSAQGQHLAAKSSPPSLSTVLDNWLRRPISNDDRNSDR